ncbi:MAG: ABC transporter permease [Chitinophagaceae bacterium]|nr:ABC transporter permease [Chitinophagaceae bacterium]
MFRVYLRVAWRSIQKNKVFSTINIFGLSLSMSCCFLIYMFVWNQVNFDSFHTSRNKIYRITEKQDQAGQVYNVAVTPGPLAPALKERFPDIMETVRFGKWSGLLKNGDVISEEKNILLTENSLFSVFNFKLIKGNPSTALKNPTDIVLTESTAAKFFGSNWSNNPSLIGQAFSLNNNDKFILAGVIQDPPNNSSINFDVLLPLTYLFNSDKWSNRWNSNNYHTYVLISPNANAIDLGAQLKDVLSTYVKDSKDLLELQPLKAQYLHSQFDFNTDWGKRGDIKYVRIFSGVGLLLLVIACINFVNLSSAKSLKRGIEVGIRKVTGASRSHLVLQFLTESLLLSFLAGLLSIIMLRAVQPAIFSITGVTIEMDFFGLPFIAAFIILVILIGFLAGIYPSFILTSFEPVKVLKGNVMNRTKKPFLKSLVVFQFAISMILIVATSFMYQQLKYIQNKNLGFDKEQLLTVRLKGELMKKAMLFKYELEQQSSIAGASPATLSMVNDDNSTYFEWDGMKADEKFLITQANITPDFIPVLGLKIIQGKNFQTQKTNDTANYIVNEKTVKQMGLGLQDVIGKQVTIWGTKGTIVGVVNDFHFKTLNTSIEPFIFRYQPEDRYFTMFVKTVPGKASIAISHLQSIYKKYESEYPLDFRFVNEALENSYASEQKTANVLFIFSCLTIFVGCLGLFGLTMFVAQQRVKEIGIRKVLGADTIAVLVLMSRDFLELIIIAIVLATPIGWFVITKWVESFPYRTEPGWALFFVSATVILLLSILTICSHAIRTSLANPAKSLRAE